MVFLPDESRSLPPPPVFNYISACLGFSGWLSALLDNGFNHRPFLRAGVHRQVLFTTVGWFIGYYLAKRTEYMYAKMDRELLEYVRQHPEDFKQAEKRRMGDVFEEFYPVR